MAETSTYSVRLPDEDKERLQKLITESDRSPSEFFAKLLDGYVAETSGRREVAEAEKHWDRIKTIISSLSAEATDQAAAARESSTSYLIEIDALTTQLNETEAAAAAAAVEASRTIQALEARAEQLEADLAEHKAAQAAATEMQMELAIMVKGQREQIAALQATLATARQQ